MAINYTFIASLGQHNDCVQILANSGPAAWNSARRLRQPSNAVWRSAVYMEKEVETWDSPLFTRPIRNATVHCGTDIHAQF